MNSTILYFNDFGKASFVHGSLNAVIEQPIKPTGPLMTQLDVHFTDMEGKERCIETTSDLVIYEGHITLISLREWSSFSTGDFLSLYRQAGKASRIFLRNNYNLKDELPEGLSSLQPRIKVAPEKRGLLNLIKKQLDAA